MPNHTPGPWTRDGTDLRIWDIRDDEALGVPIAEILRNGARRWGRRLSDEEIDANARLIAAAPDMVAQLRWMSEQIRLFGIMALPETQQRGADIAALLAKIDGAAQ